MSRVACLVSPVDGGELEPVVSGEGVAGVARVSAHPQPVVLGLPVQPGHSGGNVMIKSR